MTMCLILLILSKTDLMHIGNTDIFFYFVRICRYKRKWDMKLNVEKTKVMLIGGRSNNKVNLSADGISIEQVTEFKYL